jgi:hypothetical protein
MLLLVQAWLVLTVALLAVLGVVVLCQWLVHALRRPTPAPQLQPAPAARPGLRVVQP